MTERLESLFKEPDEEWVDRIIALTFKNKRMDKELNNDTLKKSLPYETDEYSIYNGDIKIAITKPSWKISPEGWGHS